MAEMCQICLLGLMIFSSLPTDTAGDTQVFSSSGENVSLPCNNAPHYCTSTTWNYNKNMRSAAVELFGLGIKKNDIERRDRLSLGSDCSLNIYKTTKEDHGHYYCRQYLNGKQHGTHASVFLHILHVSLLSPQTELTSGRSVDLSCQLFSYEKTCDSLSSIEGIQLVWVNQAGVDLQTDSRYQILKGTCIITLTTKLLNEDNNTELRCLLKNRNEIKASASYTVRFSANTTMTNTADINTSSKMISAVISALVLAVVLASAVLWIICKKRAGNTKETHCSVVTENNASKGMYETINISSVPTPSNDEQTNDVTYCEVTGSSIQQMIKNGVHCDDNVTYATIKGAKN